ncbi:hypothetical protein A8U91_01504 [Halomonas elongata]|uniref:Uncharacterized protein n=1 Tax=Halomonas elongata TaxID=2746 RepID=A0A1B8P4F2_HALEL|nr:hypothetical protein [Halomonas elongata]OBX37155.1 hypothetical protein A8U91_01504 [Halomonas elongata]
MPVYPIHTTARAGFDQSLPVVAPLSPEPRLDLKPLLELLWLRVYLYSNGSAYLVEVSDDNPTGLWTDKRKSAVVVDIFKAKTTNAETADSTFSLVDILSDGCLQLVSVLKQVADSLNFNSTLILVIEKANSFYRFCIEMESADRLPVVVIE